MSKKKRGIKNIREKLVIVALFAVIVLSFLLIYFSQVKADSVVAGTATAELKLYVNVSSAKNISVTANFVPTNGGTKLAATREFAFPSAGLHEAVWKVRKLPQGKYKVHLLTGSEFFQPGRNVTLNVEQINDAGKYMYYDDGTTVAKYKIQWWPQVVVGGTNSNNAGSIINSSSKDCGSASGEIDYDSWSINNALGDCFVQSYKSCEPAFVKAVGSNNSFWKANVTLEIIGKEDDLCKVRAYIDSVDVGKYSAKTGKETVCKLENIWGIRLAFSDAVNKKLYPNKSYYKQYKSTCSGSLFEEYVNYRKSYYDSSGYF